MKIKKYYKNLDVIFEDKALIVINKKAGILTHCNHNSSDNSLVKLLLKNNISLSSGENFLRPGVVHRLDKETSGLIVFAKTKNAYISLKQQFYLRKVEKYYEAIVWGVPNPIAGKINIPISGHLGKKKISYSAEAKEAVTLYKVKKNYNNNFSLIECQILTGRTHQIRVHMLSKGCPVVGDKLYSKGRNLPKNISKNISHFLNSFNRQALHSKKIIFNHPVKKNQLELVGKKPSDFLNLEKVLFEN